MLNYLITAFLVLSFFPFVSFYPVGSDLQPLVPVLALILYIYFLLSKRLSMLHVLFMLYSAILVIYINPLGELDLTFGKMFALVIACFLFVAYTIVFNSFVNLKPIMKICLYVYFIFSIFILLLPELALSVQSHIVSSLRSTEFDYRGISTLSPEPGLFSGIIVVIFAIANTMKDNFSRFEWIISCLMIFFLLAISKSGTSIALLLVFLFFKYIKINYLIYFVVFTVSFYLFFLFNQDIFGSFFMHNLGRGGEIFFALLTEPQILLNDASIMARITDLRIGFLIFLENPFGVGFGDVAKNANLIISNRPDIDNFFTRYALVYTTGASSLGYYTAALGVFFIIPFFLLFIKSKAVLENRMLALSMIVFSYSIAFPLIWLLLAFHKNKGNYSAPISCFDKFNKHNVLST